MSVILEFSVEAEEFSLGQVLGGPPLMDIELERIVPTAPALMPFIWATGDDFAAFEEKVASHPDVDEFAAVDRIEQSTLYRGLWEADDDGLTNGIVDAEATLLEGHCEGTRWEFHLRFPDHDRLTQFHNHCIEHDITLHIDRTYTLTERTQSVKQFGLSHLQREALLLALRRGYFDTPSQVTLDELAGELNISQQALSKRIRRGTRHVLGEMLLSQAADFE